MKVDRYDLHDHLWDKADRFGRCLIYQKELASELDITQATMSLIVKELTESGRIKKIAAKQRNIGIYVVRDPTQFEHRFEPIEIPGMNVMRCKRCGDLEQVGFHLDTRNIR